MRSRTVGAAVVAVVGVAVAAGSSWPPATPLARPRRRRRWPNTRARSKRKDRDRLRLLVHPRSDAEAEIDDRVIRLGGSALTVDRTDIGDTESDHTRSAELTGTLNGAPYQAKVWLQTCGDNWCVSMGPSKDGTVKPRSD